MERISGPSRVILRKALRTTKPPPVRLERRGGLEPPTFSSARNCSTQRLWPIGTTSASTIKNWCRGVDSNHRTPDLLQARLSTAPPRHINQRFFGEGGGNRTPSPGFAGPCLPIQSTPSRKSARSGYRGHVPCQRKGPVPYIQEPVLVLGGFFRSVLKNTVPDGNLTACPKCTAVAAMRNYVDIRGLPVLPFLHSLHLRTNPQV